MKRIITLTVLSLAVLLGGCDADWGVDQHVGPLPPVIWMGAGW